MINFLMPQDSWYLVINASLFRIDGDTKIAEELTYAWNEVVESRTDGPAIQSSAEETALGSSRYYVWNTDDVISSYSVSYITNSTKAVNRLRPKLEDNSTLNRSQVAEQMSG